MTEVRVPVNRATHLRLVSWNLHGTPVAYRRAARIAAAARRTIEERPTVILLQEVWLPSDRERLAQWLGAAGYAAVHRFAPAAEPGGGLLSFLRDGGEWRVAGGAFLRFQASASVWRVWEGDGLGGKGVQRIDLERDVDGQRLVILNTHLQAQHASRTYVDIRRRQIRQLADIAADIALSVPLLAAGDFNTRPEEAADHGPYADLASRWIDLVAPLREAQATPATRISTTGEPAWVDYFLARRSNAWSVFAEVEMIFNERPDEPYSDHHGLVASVEFRPWQ